MSTPENAGGTVWDAPNQQVVRPDASAPWDEGTGGTEAEPTGLAAMTKAELLALAESLGVTPANNAMTKAELQAGIEQHEREAQEGEA